MRTGRSCTFIRDERAGATVEFVALLNAFLFLFFFVLEIVIAVFWVGTVEKAAQLGARFAIVSDFAVTGLGPGQKNGVTAGFIPGDHCALGDHDPCAGFTRTCSGGSEGDCSVAGFNPIFARMDAVAPLIQPENVSITYEYAGLGFAGGPIVPRVTVKVENVEYDDYMVKMLTAAMALITGTPTPLLTNLPPIAVTFTGEDLATAGAS